MLYYLLHEFHGWIVLAAVFMLLGLDVLPEYRHQGLAREIMTRYVERERAKGRKCLYLTCLQDKVEMYKKMNYIDNGISGSAWGGEEWHDMSREI